MGSSQSGESAWARALTWRRQGPAQRPLWHVCLNTVPARPKKRGVHGGGGGERGPSREAEEGTEGRDRVTGDVRSVLWGCGHSQRNESVRTKKLVSRVG